MGAPKAQQETPRLSLREAERRLLSFRKDSQPATVELRRAFETPPTVTAEDVYVEQELYLDEKYHGREELANKIASYCNSRIAKKYSAPSADEAKVILKLYICDINAGRSEDRILATETGMGLVRLTLAWILTLKDGSVVLDGGRMFEFSTHMYGLGDILRVQDAEKTLLAMATRMSDKILNITNIESRPSYLCGMAQLWWCTHPK
jgi:hypothetical protein